MLGFESFASVGGLGRGTVVVITDLGGGVGALTVVETVSTASALFTEAGMAGFEGDEVTAADFAGVVEAVPEADGIGAVMGAGGVVVGDGAAVVVATAAAAGQRWP